MPGVSYGKRNGQAKLTEKLVKEILASEESNSVIGRRLEIDNSTISKIRLGKQWQWLSGRTYKKSKKLKHEGHPSYVSWREMRNRCRNKRHKDYPYYGARGIKVCERWMKFENFVADMGIKAPGMTLERNDNDGDYEPMNCRWATRAEQNRNNRKTRLLTFKGKTLCLVDWAKETGIKPYTIGSRIRSGWTVERALTEKP
jgi:hypothetical protein